MRTSLLELTSKLKDSTVYIVGGGQSLKGFDFSKLDGRLVIGINQACCYISNLTAIFWTDGDWAAKNDDTLNLHECKLRFCASVSLPANYTTSEIRAGGGATPLKITGTKGLDFDINNVRGNNSGSYVINLCINAGAKKIVLLGFDMLPKHWHDDYTLAYTDEVYRDFLASVHSIADLVPPDVEIINCSPISAITIFKKVEFDEV